MKASAPVLASLIVVLLGACTPSTPPSGTPGSPTAAGGSATPIVTPTSEPDPIDPNVLFTITATATSPEGAIALLTQIVYKPTATVDSGFIDQLNEECDGWKTGYPGAEFIVSDVTAVDASPAGMTWTYDPAAVDLSGYPVFKGDFDPFQSYCATVQIKADGAATGVSPLVGGASPDTKGGWAHMRYGFGIATDPSWNHAKALTKVPHLTECTIVLSDDAKATSTIAASWATLAQDDPDFGCLFGENDYLFPAG